MLSGPGSADRLGVGAPLWAKQEWVGRWLPTDTAAGSELAAYARVCNAVEGNTTFYATPDEASVRRWLESTPEGFRFVFKLPRSITHQRRLRDCDQELTSFVDRLEPLSARMGPILIQLPGSFGPQDVSVLRSFVAGLPTSFSWAVEVRHRAFHAGGEAERPINDLLHEAAVNRVMFDSRALFDGPRTTPEETEAWDRKPNNPVRPVATADQPVVRFVGQTQAAANRPYWERWVGPVARWLEQGRSPLVFLHTPDNMASPLLSREFHNELSRRGAIEPLLAAPPVSEQQQL